MCLSNCVPCAGRECAMCKQEISKAHLESCVLRSSLPNAEPGKRIDNLLFKAVRMLHAPSALLAVNILYDEIMHAFPSLWGIWWLVSVLSSSCCVLILLINPLLSDNEPLSTTLFSDALTWLILGCIGRLSWVECFYALWLFLNNVIKQSINHIYRIHLKIHSSSIHHLSINICHTHPFIPFIYVLNG